HEKRVALARQAKIKAGAQQLAERLAAVELTIARRVGEQDKLYGSVTSLDIAEALSAHNLSIDRKQILLEEPIRTLGTFEVPVKLHAEVVQPVKVTVVAEGCARLSRKRLLLALSRRKGPLRVLLAESEVGMRLRSDWARGEAPRRTTTLHDLEAERALLGGLLIDPQKLMDIEERLAPEAFYDPLHRRIYAAMLAIEDRSAIDPITVKGKLSEAGELDAATSERLRVIEESALSAANVAHYAEIVLDKALRRRLAEAAEEIANLAVEAGQDVATLSDAAERLIFSITDQSRRGEPRELQGILRETMELIQRMRERHSAVTGLSTGLYLLDQRTTGLHPGELFILAARPGVGKTSLAMNIAVHAALRADPPVSVAFLNLPYPATPLALRMRCAEPRPSQRKLKSGPLSQHDTDQRVRHAASLCNAPIYLDDTATRTISDLRSKARRLKQQHADLGLIVIDYLQLMSTRGRAESRHLEIAEISRGLK